MHPEEAVRQLEYAIDASLDETGQRTAAGYRPTFERARRRPRRRECRIRARRQTGRRGRRGDRPTPAEANETAERVLDDRAYTDGGA